MKIVAKKRQTVKSKIISECSKCLGRGCVSCSKKTQVIDAFADANIPVAYWFIKLANYQGPLNIKEATMNYISKLDEMYNSGHGLCFTGNYGVGKTTAACCILKNAIVKNYSAYYTSLNDMVQYLTDFETKSDFYHTVTRSDFLCIDEVDSRHFSGSEDAQRMFGSNFERVIRYRTQNNLPVIIASNNSTIEEVFTGQYRRVVESLSATTISVVPSLGKDFRIKNKL